MILSISVRLYTRYNTMTNYDSALLQVRGEQRNPLPRDMRMVSFASVRASIRFIIYISFSFAFRRATQLFDCNDTFALFQPRVRANAYLAMFSSTNAQSAKSACAIFFPPRAYRNTSGAQNNFYVRDVCVFFRTNIKHHVARKNRLFKLSRVYTLEM